MNRNDREELARLLPGPVERDLPGDRHHQLQEFVMSEIQRDAPPRRPLMRRPLMRRSVLVTSALTATAGVAAAIGIAVTGQPGDGPVPPGPATASGQEVLLAAANTALRQPEGNGTYWSVTVVSKDAANKVKDEWQTWVDRDGANWIRFARGIPDPNSTDPNKRIDKAIRWGDPGFSLCGPVITFAQLQNLPTTPDALKASVSALLDTQGALEPADKRKRVLYGLVALVSQLPAPPKVRAAAFQAIAAYPGVVNGGPVDGGPVDGGLALRIPVHEGVQARLVIDPVAAQIRETDFLVMNHMTLYAADGGSMTLTAEWTDSPPA